MGNMGKGNRKFITSIVAFLIISMGMTLFLFRTNVEASILGAKYYYLALEKDNFKKIKNKLKANYVEKNLIDFSYACKLNAELVGDVLYSEPDIKTLADYISKFDLSINYNGSSKNMNDVYYTSLISTKYDGKKLLDVDVKSADNKAIIAFPELTDKTMGIETSNKSLKFTQAFLDDDKAFEEIFGITRVAYNKLIEKYIKDIIFNEIPEDNVVFNDKANFENIECNSITFNIDQNVIANIYKAVAKELANDKEFKTVCTSITNAFYDIVYEQQKQLSSEILSEKPTAEEIDEQIQMICDELNEGAENLDEIQFTYTAYFKNDGDILSRQVKDKLSDTEIKFSSFKDLNGVEVIKFLVGGEKETAFELTNEAKLQSGAIYAGKFNVNISGKSLVDAKYTYEKDAKVGNLSAFVGEIEGKINLEQLGEGGLTNYIDNDLNNIYFSLVNRRTDIDTLIGKTKITSKVDGKRMGINLYTEVKQSNVANITKPVVTIDNSVKLTDSLGINEMGTEIGESLMSKILEIFPQIGGMYNDELDEDEYDY